MIKILFFADSHLGFDFPIRPRISRRRRGVDFFNNYQRILNTALQEKVDVVVHGGDVFFRSKIPLPIVQKTYEPLLPLLEQGIKLFFVPGNHERSSLPDTPLFHHHNFYLYDRPRSFKLEINGVYTQWGGFPNIRNGVESEFSSILSGIGFNGEGEDCVNILCMHQSIENAVVGAQDYTFRKGPDVIRLDQFPEYLDLVLSGHIHRNQVLRSTHGTPLIYSGSIERTSFAERLETKGFYIVELDENDVKWVFHPLPARSMHEMSLPRQLTHKTDLLAAVEEQADSLPEDAILRVRTSTDEQLQVLKTSDLRGILPETMNVDLLPEAGGSRFRWSAYSD